MKWLRLIFEVAIVLLLIGGGVFATTTYATSTYNTGYAIGHHLGYQAGYTNGKNYGYNQGYENGHSDGYSQGYEDGHTDGQNLGYTNGFQVGIAENTIACWIVQNHPIVNALYLNLTCSQQ